MDRWIDGEKLEGESIKCQYLYMQKTQQTSSRVERNRKLKSAVVPEWMFLV